MKQYICVYSNKTKKVLVIASTGGQGFMAVINKQQHKLSNEELAALPFVSCQIEVGDVVPHATFDPLTPIY